MMSFTPINRKSLYDAERRELRRLSNRSPPVGYSPPTAISVAEELYAPPLIPKYFENLLFPFIHVLEESN